jgi:hypothetical protein
MGGRGLNAETLSAQREEKAGRDERDRLECNGSMHKGSMTLYYCQ